MQQTCPLSNGQVIFVMQDILCYFSSDKDERVASSEN